MAVGWWADNGPLLYTYWLPLESLSFSEEDHLLFSKFSNLMLLKRINFSCLAFNSPKPILEDDYLLNTLN